MKKLIMIIFISIFTVISSYSETPTKSGIGHIKNIVVFGDSLSDVGYYNGLPQITPNWPNVPDTGSPKQPTYTTPIVGDSVWPQYLKSFIGMTVRTNNTNTPPLNKKAGVVKPAVDGHIYAAGGASTVCSGIPGSNYAPPPIGPALQGGSGDECSNPKIQKYNQIDNYLNQCDGKANPDNVFIIWGGANDIFITLEDIVSDRLSPEAGAKKVRGFAQDIINDVKYLQGKGANKIIVLTLPNLGITPLVTENGKNTNSQAAQLASLLSNSFNNKLKEDIPKLNNSDSKVILLDDDKNFFEEIMAKKELNLLGQKFYFINTTESSCPIGDDSPNSLTCVPKDLNSKTQYLFADSVHPTTYTHKALAYYIYLNGIKKLEDSL